MRAGAWRCARSSDGRARSNDTRLDGLRDKLPLGVRGGGAGVGGLFCGLSSTMLAIILHQTKKACDRKCARLRFTASTSSLARGGGTFTLTATGSCAVGCCGAGAGAGTDLKENMDALESESDALRPNEKRDLSEPLLIADGGALGAAVGIVVVNRDELEQTPHNNANALDLILRPQLISLRFELHSAKDIRFRETR